MGQDDAAHDGEPQAGTAVRAAARGLPAVEAIEEARQPILGHPGAASMRSTTTSSRNVAIASAAAPSTGTTRPGDGEAEAEVTPGIADGVIGVMGVTDVMGSDDARRATRRTTPPGSV